MSLFNDFFDDKIFTYTTNLNPKLNTKLGSFCNIYTENDAYVFDLYLPGYSKSDFNIDVNNQVLHIDGCVSNSDKKDYLYQELAPIETFRRSWTLPKNVNVEQINASYKSGILSVTVPLLKETSLKSKKIDID